MKLLKSHVLGLKLQQSCISLKHTYDATPCSPVGGHCTCSVLQMNIIPLLVTMNKKNKKSTGQIKFLAVTLKQRIKLDLQHSLCKNEFNVLVPVTPLHSFFYSISCLVK